MDCVSDILRRGIGCPESPGAISQKGRRCTGRNAQRPRIVADLQLSGLVRQLLWSKIVDILCNLLAGKQEYVVIGILSDVRIAFAFRALRTIASRGQKDMLSL